MAAPRLGPVLREYIVSEAMAAMGIPTTRSLAAVMTGESVMRETVLAGSRTHPRRRRATSGSAHSSILRRAATPKACDSSRITSSARHYPEAAQAERRPYHALLQGVIARQAELIARWLLVGFIHGVMNTDNSSISGETIDYGPCAFMDDYNPATVFSARSTSKGAMPMPTSHGSRCGT